MMIGRNAASGSISFSAQAIAAVLLLSACAQTGPLPEVTDTAQTRTFSQSSIDPDIAEAVFRYQFRNNASGQQSQAQVYCIGYGSRLTSSVTSSDPSDAFLGRFADVHPDVKASSQCSASAYTGVIETGTGAHGLIFTIYAVRTKGDSQCEVDGGYYESGESASGETYFLEKKNGAWTVVRSNMRWIS